MEASQLGLAQLSFDFLTAPQKGYTTLDKKEKLL